MKACRTRVLKLCMDSFETKAITFTHLVNLWNVLLGRDNLPVGNRNVVQEGISKESCHMKIPVQYL